MTSVILTGTSGRVVAFVFLLHKLRDRRCSACGCPAFETPVHKAFDAFQDVVWKIYQPIETLLLVNPLGHLDAAQGPSVRLSLGTKQGPRDLPFSQLGEIIEQPVTDRRYAVDVELTCLGQQHLPIWLPIRKGFEGL